MGSVGISPVLHPYFAKSARTTNRQSGQISCAQDRFTRSKPAQLQFGLEGGSPPAWLAQIPKIIDFCEAKGMLRNIPEINPNDRSTHRAHLRVINQAAALLSPARSAADAAEQYIRLFQTVETRLRGGLPLTDGHKTHFDISTKKTMKGPEDARYYANRDRNYLSIGGPNGAFEMYRLNVPKSVDVVFPSIKMSSDIRKLNQHLEQPGKKNGLPEMLHEPDYVKVFAKPGIDGNDAWNQPFQAKEQQEAFIAEFQDWLKANPDNKSA